MASLANVSPGSSYPGLLKTENNTGVTGSLQTITDGEGTVLPLQLSCDYVTNYGKGGVSSNTIFGQNALSANISGSGISAFGIDALKCNTTGNCNTAFGGSSSELNTTGVCNTSLGFESLYVNTTGISNTAIGARSQRGDGIGPGTGGGNTSIGGNSLQSILSGSGNSTIGWESGKNVVSGSFNTASGYRALRACSISVSNTTLLGAFSGQNNTASCVVGIGFNTLAANQGSNNTSVGFRSLQANTTGSGNTAIGNCNSINNTSGSNNTVIGNLATSSNNSSSIILGACAAATANNQFVVGATGAFNAGAITVESVSPTHTWQVRINGQNYKIPLIPV
jgi:hypothetical protein